MKCTAGKETPLGVLGEHAWVLVPRENLKDWRTPQGKLLWACPCDEFKWTSYAQWERGQEAAKERERDAIFRGGDQEIEIMTNDPNQGESTAYHTSGLPVAPDHYDNIIGGGDHHSK